MSKEKNIFEEKIIFPLC